MAGGKMGDLWISLDIKSEIDKKLRSYAGSLGAFHKQVNSLQGKINELAEGLGKLDRGSDAWKRQKAEVEGLFRNVSELVNRIRSYEAAIGRVENISRRVNAGGLLGPSRTFTTKLDTKPLEDQITKYEALVQKIQDLQAKIRQREGYRDSIRLDAEQGTKGLETWNEYQRRIQAVDAEISKLSADLKNLGGQDALNNAKTQLNSLYAELERWDAANKRAASSTRTSREEEQRRAKVMKDARIAFEPLVAAQARAEAQERANRANIEATNQARQRSVQVLRQQAEAMMQNHIAALQSQKTSLGHLYTQGKAMGLDSSELQTILSRYREIAQELLNMRTLMQNPGGMGYRDMFSMGRFAGAGANYVREATAQVSGLRQQTQEAAMAARNLATAFDRVHSAAQKSSSVLSDMKSLFLQGGLVFGAQQFARSIIQTGGDIVQQHIALRSILGDVQKADELFAQTQQLALQSPFKFQELNRDVKQLAAFGVDADRLYDTTKRLADVASGLGVSFERLGLAYGQVKARSWLDGKELRQFAYAGLPMLEKIAQLYNDTRKNGRSNYTTSDVRTMITKRQVSFEDVDEVFQRLTNEGGQFYNMQFVLSETLLGRWNKLEDAWSIMLGKFADGKSIIGQVFMTAIDGATEFVLQLDKISPLLLSFGAAFAGRKLFGAATGALGLGSLTREMTLAQGAALKTYATRQMQDVLEGKITAKVAQQNILSQKQLLASKEVQGLAYVQLATAGKISVMQMGELARRGQISAATVSQLEAMGAINSQQAVLLNQLRMEGALRKSNLGTMMQLGISGIGSKMGGLFSGGNLAMAGATVGLSLWMGYKQWSDRLNADIKTIEDSSKQAAKRYGDFLNSLGGKGDGGLQQQVDSMKEVLETSGDYTDTIKEQVENAKSLSEQYDILKKNIQDAAEVNGMMAGSYGRMSAGASAATGTRSDALFNMLGLDTPRILEWANGLTNDDLEKNASDALNSLQRYQLMFDELDRNTQLSMAKFIQNLASKNKELSDMIQGLPIAEQIRVLAFTGGADWEAFVEKFGRGSDEVNNWLSELSKRARKSSDDVSEIMYDDVPKGLEYIRKELGLSQADFRQWAAKNPKIFATMMDEMARKANITSKTILYYFHQAISGIMNYDFWPNAPQGNRGRRAYNPGLSGLPIQSIRRSLINSRTMVSGRNVGEYDTKLRKVQDETWEKTAQNIQSEYKEARNEYDQISSYAKKQGNGISAAVRAQMGSLRRQLSQWESIANAAGVTLDVGKNGTTGNFGKQRAQRDRSDQLARKADNDDEKRLKARLQLIKDAYATYEKYYKLLHDEQQAAKVVSDQYKGKGLSNDDVAKITSRGGYRELIEGYLRMARGMNYRRPNEMRERKDEDIAAGVRELNELDINVLTEQLDDFASTVNRDLDEMGRKWELYQQVLKSQGSPELAARISGLAGDSNARDYAIYNNSTYVTGYARRMSDYIRTYLGSLVLSGAHPDRAIDYDSLMTMSDKEIEQYAGSLFAATDASKVKGFIDAFKELKKLVTDTEFKEGVEVFDDLLSKIITQAAQQGRDNQRYNDTINKLEPLRSTDPEGYRRAKAVADANHAYENLQAEDAYKQFMSQITSMTQSAAEDMRDRILNNLMERFKAGTITAEEYMDGLKQVNEQMEAFGNKHGNAYAFFGGGLQGLAQNMKSNALDQIYTDVKNGGSGAAGMAALKGGSGFASTVAMVDTIVNGINDNVQAYKKLEETWTGAFGNGLANSKFSNFMGGFTEASQGAADAWNSLKSGNLTGVIDGGIRSFTGWFSWGNAAANKRWQEQAEYLKGFQKTLSEINSTLKNKVSSVYGSMSATYANELQRNLGSEAAEVRKTYRDWSQAHTITRNHRNRMYTNLDYDQINAYLRSIGYTGSAVGGDTIQNLSGDYLEKIRERFAGQWSKLPDEAQEYLNRLIEIESETGEITEATKALSEALTGLNVETLQSEYANLLDQLDSDNEDFADNLEKHLRSAILSTMIANLYKDRIEDLVDYTTKMADTKAGRYVSRNGTIKTHTGGDDSADVMSEYTSDEYEAIRQKEEALANDLRNSRDYLRDLYGWSDGSSSMTSSIQGMTEQTGDLLAAYLNAIGADVSVLRQLDGVYWPKIDITTQAQLQQLNMITENTLRNAEAAERIDVAVTDLRDMLSRAQSNTKPIYVRAQ